jgi:beta-galactosidase
MIKKTINSIWMALFLLIVLLFDPKVLFSQNSGSEADSQKERQILLINEGWQYTEDRILSVRDVDAVDIEWQRLDLPHTWNQFDATDNNPGYRRDESWYKKELEIPDLRQNETVILYFEGVNISCDIYVNGKSAGGHIGGYVGFRIDITPHVIPNKNNRIVVRVDNSIDRNIIPSQKSDFFIFGGITRDVWLEILPPVYIKNVQISTPQVSGDNAQTSISLDIHSKSPENIQSKIKLTLTDPKGKIVAQNEIQKNITPGENPFKISLPPISNPMLWSPDSPSLYTLHMTATSESSVDAIREKIGYRWFEFAEHGPFYLNGERLLLRGTHRHEEFAGYGNALPNSLHRQDMIMIKEMGANFVRLAHYPQDPEVYRACDELGLLVWDELPWCRGGVGGTVWKKHTLRLLKEQIKQNYNHPSIILWSLGNEMYWESDFDNGGNIDSLRSFLIELNDLAHELDPGRKTALRKFYDADDIVDVFSPSIWAGWYSGVYKSYEKALTKARDKYKRLIHTEYGGSSHVGRHTENPITGEGTIKDDEWAEKPNMIGIKKISSDGDWSENYIVDLFDWHLQVSEQLDWFAGNAQWAFKDFGTPLRPENAIPYINQKGLVDREGKPKDAYYVFKSYWTTDPKFCYIESPTWVERHGQAGQKRQICVYSNCEKVQLFVNGTDYESRERKISQYPACGLNWQVVFSEGRNQIIANGYSEGEIVTRDTVVVNYSTAKFGKPVEIELLASQLENGHFKIHARMVDADGNTCLDYNKRVYFDQYGPGKLRKYYGTPSGSDIIEFASGRAAIEFIPEGNGIATIEARNQDFKGSYIKIKF